jgi:large subunit ribosomal protein L7A
VDVTALLTAKKVVGTKETLRMVEKHQCKVVFVAHDANPEVVEPLLDLCRQSGVEVVMVKDMKTLGECCGIKVAAASAGIV